MALRMAVATGLSRTGKCEAYWWLKFVESAGQLFGECNIMLSSVVKDYSLVI